MAATLDLIKLKRQRRLAWYTVFALFFFGVVFANFGFEDAGPIAFLLIFAALLYVLLLGFRIRRAEREQEESIGKDEVKLPPYWKILVGNLLFAWFVLLICSSSVLLANLSALVVIGVLLPMALSAGKGSSGLRRQRWTRFLIYAVAVSVGWMLDHQASENEQRNFNSIIAAVEQYKAAEQRYPDTLQDLTPNYLTAIPTGRWGRFMYYADNPNDAHLTHTRMPPVRETYSFKSKTSRTWD